MTQHDIEEALDAFIQQRLADYDLSQDIEDVMDGYDWHSAVQGVTDDLDLASTDSVEELEEIVGRIRERQEEAAQARDAQNDTISRIARDLALCMGRDWIGLTDRMEAVEGIDTRRAPWRAKTEERLAGLEALQEHQTARLDAHASTIDGQATEAERLAERIGERLEWRIAALEAVMIGQVSDEDPGEVEELREMLDAAHAERQAQEHQALTDGLADAEARTLERATWYAAVQARAQEHQAQPDHLVETMDAQRQALDRIVDLVEGTGAVDDAHAIRARQHATEALQALVDAHQAQQWRDQA